MGERRGIFKRRGSGQPGGIEPIRVGDMLPVAPEEAPQQVAARVQGIIEAAQENAKEIERFAHADAERIRAEAVAEAEAHVARVRASTAAIERRGAALEEAIAEIVAGLGRGAAQLDRELAEAIAEAAAPLAAAGARGELAAGDEPGAGEPEPVEADDAASVATEPSEPDSGDVDGARLVALDQMLEGRDRDELAAELRSDFPGVDVERILDDVYASFGDETSDADAGSDKQ